MEKIYEKLDKLKKTLDNTGCIQKTKMLKRELLDDKELISLIEKYKYTQDEKVKKEIISNELFQKYKQQETELNLLILEINQELKKIVKKDKCGL